MRKLVIIIIAIAILGLGFFVSGVLGKGKERPAKKVKQNVTTVFTKQVENDTVSIFVEATGALEAVKRIELFSEVQGVMEADNGRFKAGNSFKKGEVLIRIRSNDQQAQVYSQRSAFQSSLMAVMPDLKADHEAEFQKWNSYLQESTKKLPEVTSEKLKSFLVGRGIYSAYHNLKNLEIINAKYSLVAPYNGVLISANVDPGTVIRPGQALGVFIQPEVYELETAVDAVTAERLKTGQKVELSMQGLDSKKWTGTISRLVKAIDKTSQMSTFFVEVEGDDLKEGMFLNAEVKANEVTNAIEISRAALVDNSQVYTVKDSILVLKPVSIEHFNQSTAVVTGLENGQEVLTKVPPAAFEGMKVTVYKEKR